jgi:outer membrane lipoprotein-sorting protein
MMKRLTLILLVVSLSLLNVVVAQKEPGTHDARAILEKAAKEFQEVQDFTVTIQAEVNMEQVQIPKMNAIMYFKRPDKIHFSSQNFLLVPRDGIALNPVLLWERYDASFVKVDSMNGQKLFELQLAAKETKTKLRQLYVWIDTTHWTIAKIETVPYEGRTLTMIFTYELQSERYWLPSQMIVSLGSTQERENTAGEPNSQTGDQFGHMQRGMPRNGTLTIQYSGYKVNTGLDDAIFWEKEK